MISAADLIVALGLIVQPDLADAIDRVCGPSSACRADAVATCYVETRCQTHHCGRNGCGPFQQLARYADDVPELEGLSYEERRALLVSDPVIAAAQWKAVKDRYEARHGNRWPHRYNGSPNADRYLEQWTAIRARLTRFIRSSNPA